MRATVLAPGLVREADGTKRPLRILHVTECFGAGVGRAVKLRAQALPQAEHHLLWTGEETPASSQWASTTELPASDLSRIRATTLTTRQVNPDIVHAHSSWAGVYARVGVFGRPVVYEPHCFKFDDPSLRRPVSGAFRLAERLLMARTAAIGILSPHERAVVRTMSRRLPAVEIPNIPTMPTMPTPSPTPPGQSDSGPIDVRRVAMVGRIAPQKEPKFFADVVAELRKDDVPLEAVWIGDGDGDLRRLLTEARIRVTGWLSPSGVEELLRGSVYVHSARYEGFPLSILDAAACRAPIVARRIAAVEHTDLLMSSTPRGVAALVTDMLGSADALADARARNTPLLRAYSPQRLTDALTMLYSKALAA